MSWDAVKTVIQRGPHLDLDHFEFRVLLYLADRQNARTGQLNPSPERLAIDCGRDPTTTARHIIRVLRRLEAKGLVERVGSSKGGRGRTQHYRLHLTPNPGTAAGVSEGETLSSVAQNPVIGDPKTLSLAPPEPKDLEPRYEPSELFHNSARVPPKGNPSASTPNRSGRISDALLARVRELDPDAVRETRHDGTEYIWLSDGTELPNSTRAEMWTRYEGQYR